VFSRHTFVWLTHRETLADVIAGCEAAWTFFGGVFGVMMNPYRYADARRLVEALRATSQPAPRHGCRPARTMATHPHRPTPLRRDHQHRPGRRSAPRPVVVYPAPLADHHPAPLGDAASDTSQAKERTLPTLAIDTTAELANPTPPDGIETDRAEQLRLDDTLSW